MTALLALVVSLAPLAAEPAPRVPEVIDGPTLAARLAARGPRVRLVSFWATWCAPCIAELPALRAFAQRHPEIDVVLVNVDPVAVQGRKASAVLAEHRLEAVTSWFLASPDPSATLRAHVPGWPDSLPTTLVIRPDGRRAAIHTERLDAAGLAALVRTAER